MGSAARRTAGTAAAGLVALAGLALLVAPQASGEVAAALLALAVLEHWFMVLPLPVAALWPGFKAQETEKALVFPASTIDRRGT